MKRHPNFVGKIDLDKSEWAKSLFQRMGFRRRKATSSKLMVPAGAEKEAELLFHHAVKKEIEKRSIPDSLVINFDQTPSNFVPVTSTNFAKRNTKQVCVKGSNNKRAITAIFTVTPEGQFLGMQLIYVEKTNFRLGLIRSVIATKQNL